MKTLLLSILATALLAGCASTQKTPPGYQDDLTPGENGETYVGML